ncbi:hypothetical protein TWF694_001890 [Orbilia ellipsospora]|uniref:F-box domain-containing protein n=1 Tax=Orbilia ellipsospora TaxID=2528407 RepID=A0AAV9X474_9PEZI
MDQLSSEILLQILGDPCLSDRDLASAQQTCKRFNDILQHYIYPERTFTLTIDSPEFSCWKLARAILERPSLGEQFRSIKFEFKRRDAYDKKTWFGAWEWQEQELDQINGIHRQWREIFPALCLEVIRAGINSEALLPLLLCLIPNLKSLDLRNVESQVVVIWDDYDSDESEDSGFDLSVQAIGGDPDYHDHKLKPNQYHKFPSANQANRMDRLWFWRMIEEARTTRNWPPGLINLESLAVEGEWCLLNCYTALHLPRMVVVRFESDRGSPKICRDMVSFQRSNQR